MARSRSTSSRVDSSIDISHPSFDLTLRPAGSGPEGHWSPVACDVRSEPSGQPPPSTRLRSAVRDDVLERAEPCLEEAEIPGLVGHLEPGRLLEPVRDGNDRR